jgi:hypothetical protein
MGIAAEILIPALGRLDPVLAKLCLPLAVGVERHVEG